MALRLSRRGLHLGRLALAVLSLGMGRSRAVAQEMPVPLETQVPLLLKILTFDRTLSDASGEPLVVGIVFQGRNRTSSEIGEEVRSRLQASARAIRVVAIDLDQTQDLRAALLRDGVRVLYVAPLQAVAVSAVAAATRERQVLSYTGVPHYVEQGLAVGIDVNGMRPQIVINLAASRAEGALFSAQLLKLVRLTGPETSAP
jgi:hypothetical protein